MKDYLLTECDLFLLSAIKCVELFVPKTDREDLYQTAWEVLGEKHGFQPTTRKYNQDSKIVTAIPV